MTEQFDDFRAETKVESNKINIQEIKERLDGGESCLAFLGHGAYVLQVKTEKGPKRFIVDLSRTTHIKESALGQNLRTKEAGQEIGVVSEEQALWSLEEIERLGEALKPDALVITHTHMDHLDLAAVEALVKGTKKAGIFPPQVIVPMGLVQYLEKKHQEKGLGVEEALGEAMGPVYAGRGKSILSYFGGIAPRLYRGNSVLNSLASQTTVGGLEITGFPALHDKEIYDAVFKIETPKGEPTIVLMGDTPLNKEFFATMARLAEEKDQGKHEDGLTFVIGIGGLVDSYYMKLPPGFVHGLREITEEAGSHSTYTLLAMIEMFPEAQIFPVHHGGPKELMGGLEANTQLLTEKLDIPSGRVKLLNKLAGKKDSMLTCLDELKQLTPSRQRRADFQATYATIVDLIKRYFEKKTVTDTQEKKKEHYVLSPKVQARLNQQVTFLQRGDVADL